MITILNLSGVYQLKNKINNDIYIGSTVNLRKRKAMHFHLLRKNEHHNSFLQKAFDEYGEENFIFEVLLYCDKQFLTYYEQKLLDKFVPEYNISTNSESNIGIKLSQETRDKMSKSHIGKKASEETRKKIAENSKNISDETRKKLSESRKGEKHHFFGKHLSKEHIEKLIESHTGQIPWNKGIPCTEETKNKISIAKVGKKQSEETKKKRSLSIKKYWNKKRKENK
jgi:group I intron endonuclease